jgi:hypothetical protein
MCYNGGAARSCSSFADPTQKKIQRFKAKVFKAMIAHSG